MRNGSFDARVDHVVQQVMDQLLAREAHIDPVTVPIWRKILDERMAPFVEQNEPIPFVVPAFPFKSVLPSQTLGTRADKAESMALLAWKRLLDRIKIGYKAGANLKVYSAGLMFLRSLQKGGFPYTEEMASKYKTDLEQIINRLSGSGEMSIVSLPDFYQGTLDEQLVQLVADHQPLSIQQAKAAKLAAGSTEYQELKSYYWHDLLELRKTGVIDSVISGSKLDKRAGEMAAESVWLTAAWANLIASHSPGAIRISIHPLPLHRSPFAKERLGLSFGSEHPWFEDRVTKMGEVTGTRLSPWRSVWLQDEAGNGGRVKNWVAQSLGGELAIDPETGRPSHYILKR